MPKVITNEQITLYRNSRSAGKIQATAAARAGFCIKTGYLIEHNMRILKTERKRQEKSNAIDKVFESIIIPLLKEHDYQGTFLLAHLQELFPGEYCNSLLRTLQRRIEEWKSSQPKDIEIMFRQEHKPGELVVCDFTHPKEKIKVTLRGEPFKHILFHARLPYSGMSYMQAFEGTGESIEKFTQGLNNALGYFQGVPEKLKTDSLSAAFKNLRDKEKEAQTQLFKAFIDHYGMESERINKGKPHENGAIESVHGHAKTFIGQCLSLRRKSDFDTIEEYQAFIMECIEKRNLRCNVNRIATDRAALKPLPATPAIEYKEVSVRVSSGSIIQVRNSVYTVPNTLIGKMLLVRLYSDRLECYLGQHRLTTLKRVHSTTKERSRNIDPKHLLPWLIRKPGAFADSVYREDLLKNPHYRYIWELLNQRMVKLAASKCMLRLLKLAYIHGFEEEVATIIVDRLSKHKDLDLNALENKLLPKQEVVPVVTIMQHSLSSYKDLMQQGALQ